MQNNRNLLLIIISLYKYSPGINENLISEEL